MKYNPQNERIKRAYFTLLKQADQMADTTIDGVRKALLRLEESTAWADFSTFDSNQAIAFKKHLTKSQGQSSGRPLSHATVFTTVRAVQEFLRWLTDPEQNGAGALTDFGCYGANLMTYLMHGARPSSVTAITQNFQPNDYPDVDDEATIILTYPRAQAVIQASWNWPISRKDMEIYGARGYVMTDNRSQIRVRPSESVAETTRQLPESAAPAFEPFSYFKGLIAGEIAPRAFDPSSLENNMLVMEILDAAMRSAAKHTTIFLEKSAAR